jgi:hypothetical protein
MVTVMIVMMETAEDLNLKNVMDEMGSRNSFSAQIHPNPDFDPLENVFRFIFFLVGLLSTL